MRKNICLKKIVLNISAAVFIMGQLSGCAAETGKELRSAIDTSQIFQGLSAMIRGAEDKMSESLAILAKNDGVGEGKTDLTKIYDPNIFTDLNNMTVNPTDEMYETLALFGITEETHDVEMVMEGIMYDVLMNSETITSADIEAAIKGYGETYRKTEDIASGGQETETQPQEQAGGNDIQQAEQPAAPEQPPVSEQQIAQDQPVQPPVQDNAGGDSLEGLDQELLDAFNRRPAAGQYTTPVTGGGSLKAN